MTERGMGNMKTNQFSNAMHANAHKIANMRYDSREALAGSESQALLRGKEKKKKSGICRKLLATLYELRYNRI